jgi:hypothetical protein
VSIVEIKCPHCGSVCTQKGSDPNEYACSHCGSFFRLMDSTKRTITTDVAIHGCLYCGKSLDAGRGFKCTRCGREYFCESCVDLVRDRYVCIECISKSNENCQLCKKYAVYTCLICGRRACKTHPKHMGFSTYTRGLFESDKISQTEIVLYCENCQRFICSNCAKRSFLSRLSCPNCGTTLTEYSPYR